MLNLSSIQDATQSKNPRFARFSPRISSRIESHYVVLLLVIALLYLVPALCGFPTWPGALNTAKILKFDNVWDTLTFGADHRPIRKFIARELWSGHLPLWMPTNILGLPLLEQYEYQILNPLEWLNYLGGDLWWTAVLCGYLFVGGLGVHAIGNRIGVDKWAAIGGAVSYVAAGHVTLFYAVPSWTAAIPIIPWIFYCAATIIAHPFGAKHFLCLWISSALLLLTGQPQIIVCTAYFAGFFVVTMLLLTFASSRDYGQAALSLLVLGGAGGLAVATAAPQIIPFADFILSTDAFTGHPFSLSGWRVSAVNFLNLIFPFSMGTTPYENWTVDPLIRVKPSEDFPITLYCVGSFLALMGIASSYRATLMRIERVSYSLTVLFTLGTIGLYGMLHWRTWPFEFVHLARYTCPVLGVLLSIMVAIGVDSLTKQPRRELWFASIIFSIGVTTLATIIALNFRPEVVKSQPMLIQVSTLSGASLLIAIALFLILLNPNRRTGIAAIVLFLSDATFQIRYGFDLSTDIFRLIPLVIMVTGALLFHFRAIHPRTSVFASAATIVAGWGYYAATQNVTWPHPEIAAAEFVKGHRIATSLVAYSADSNTAYNVTVLGSRNPITFNRLQDFLFAPGADLPKGMTLATTTIRDWRGFSDITTGPDQEVIRWEAYCAYRKRFNAISADMLLGYQGGTIDKLTTYPGCESGMKSIDTNNNRFSAYQDENALPRAYFTTSCRGMDRYDLPLIHNNLSSLASSPFVERGNTELSCEGKAPDGPLSLKLSDVSPSIVDIATAGLPAGLVVLNDQFFKSWNAYVDGKKVEVLRVNSIMRGVIISTGTRSLRFSYEPKLGGLLALSSISLILALVSGAVLNKRLSSAPRETGEGVLV